jgi:hypothetical protein
MAKAIRFDYFKVYARQYNQEKDLVEDGICDLTNVYYYFRTAYFQYSRYI